MKSIIIAALAAASFVGVASATDSYTFSSAASTISLGDVTGTFTISGGTIYYRASTTTWSNSSALTTMNTELATNVTSLSGIVASGNGGTGTFTLDFSNSTTYSEGTPIVMYVTVGARDVTLGDLTITGLDDMTITYATDTGSGFSETATYSTGGNSANAITLLRLAGTVTSSSVVISSTTGKSGVGYVAIATTAEVAANVAAAAVPEPATATLSLLALASLAARRRRK